MRKIAISLSKGGVGKTTTAVNLAAGLASQGRRVLLIDLDTQGQAGKMLGLQPERGLADLITEDAQPQDAVVAARPGLSLIGGGRDLAGAKRFIARQDYGGERTLSDALAPLDGAFDFALLDTAPGWDSLSVNALFYVDEVLCPVALEVMALQGLLEFSKNLDAIQKYRSNLMLRYIVPTFMDRRVKKSQEILDLLSGHYPQQLCPSIRYNVRLSEAPGFGQTIYEYAPKSHGAEDYEVLSKRIAEDG